MARPALSQDAIAAFREQLCALALRRFAEHGYAAVTLRALARELGVSHAMIYRYFDDKAALFAAVRLRSVERFIDYQRQRLAARADARESLLEGARSYVDFAVAEPHAFRVMFDLDQPRLADDPPLAAAHRRAFGLLEAVVERAVRDGVLSGEPSRVTQQLWASIHGVAALHLSGQLTADRAVPLAVSIAEIVLAGLSPGRPT